MVRYLIFIISSLKKNMYINFITNGHTMFKNIAKHNNLISFLYMRIYHINKYLK
jgi:hypothetical protein